MCQLGLLAALPSLDLGLNLFTGTIPAEIMAMAALTDLDLRSNRLTGSIPLGQVVGTLRRFIVCDNLLTVFGAWVGAPTGSLASIGKCVEPYSLDNKKTG
jgi:hypothetical protein